MAGRLDGKVAIVTGAGRGLGRAIARGFAAEGAEVAVLSRGRDGIDRTVTDIKAAGGTALGIQCDVFDLERIDAAVAETVAAFGTVDILVNNSWDQESALAPIMDITVEQLRRQLESGPMVYLRFMQACFPHMDGRDGRIINLASCVGTLSYPGRGPYAMAKEAVRALTRTAARVGRPACDREQSAAADRHRFLSAGSGATECQTAPAAGAAHRRSRRGRRAHRAVSRQPRGPLRDGIQLPCRRGADDRYRPLTCRNARRDAR